MVKCGQGSTLGSGLGPRGRFNMAPPGGGGDCSVFIFYLYPLSAHQAPDTRAVTSP